MSLHDAPSTFPNQFKMDLLAGKRLIGCWASLTRAINSDLLGVAGFDWILLDGGCKSIDNILSTRWITGMKHCVSTPFVRPTSSYAIEIKRLREAGFHNFLVPFVESAEDARHAVTSIHYQPQAKVGESVALHGNLAKYLQEANEHMCLAVQIETRRAVNSTAEIASVPGVDCIFIAPSDLAAGFGHFGNANHPEVQGAIAMVFAQAKAQGKPTGILTPVESDARRYIGMGATFIAVGSRDRYLP